ncbi:MAG: hypothetical protein AAB731_00220 [Patescibacteria group bacterium]
MRDVRRQAVEPGENVVIIRDIQYQNKIVKGGTVCKFIKEHSTSGNPWAHVRTLGSADNLGVWPIHILREDYVLQKDGSMLKWCPKCGSILDYFDGVDDFCSECNKAVRYMKF